MAEKQNLSHGVFLQWGGSGNYIPFQVIGPWDFADPYGVSPEMPAVGSIFAPINFSQGLAVPTVSFTTLIDTTWLSAANLNALLVTRDAGGYLSATPPALQVKHGGYYYNYSACKCAAFRIVHAMPGPGSPGVLLCQMTLYGYGTVTAPSTSATGVLSAASPLTAFQPQDVDYMAADLGTNSIDGVFGWNLSISTGLGPYLTSPPPTALSAGAKATPEDCVNGPLMGSFFVDQKKSAANVLDAASSTGHSACVIRLKSPDLTSKVVFTLQMLTPDTDRPSQPIGLSRVGRTYNFIQPDGSTAPIAIAAGA